MANRAEQFDKMRETQASILLRIAGSMRLFRTPEGEAYTELPIDDRWETHPLKSKAVRNWLTLLYYETYQGSPSKMALESTLAVLESKAHFRSEVHETFLRLAWHEGIIYLDLGNEQREVVRISAEGWTVETEVPVRFRRPRSMGALPLPVRGGSLNDLRQFLNVPNDSDKEWMLMVSWLVGAFHPTGPYPVLALHGEKGSAKSTTTRYLRALIDPSTAMAPVQPRDSQDLTIKAHHNWVVAFDNMSSMPRWLSDGLCRLATGASDSKRELY